MNRKRGEENERAQKLDGRVELERPYMLSYNIHILFGLPAIGIAHRKDKPSNNEPTQRAINAIDSERFIEHGEQQLWSAYIE